MEDYGFVYLIGNNSMPSIYKIGKTSRPPTLRVKELSSGTSVPESFYLICYGETSKSSELEIYLHDMFNDFRVSNNREFFKLEKTDFENLVDEILINSENFTPCLINGDFNLVPFHIKGDK